MIREKTILRRGAINLAPAGNFFNARGFTLLETLVALVIAATAAAVILSNVRTLMLRAEKEHSHQSAVLQVINDSLRLSRATVTAASLHLRPEKNCLILEGHELSQLELSAVQACNIAVKQEPLPPITFAYTPFQSFGVSRGQYSLYFVAPALPTPDNIEKTSKATANAQSTLFAFAPLGAPGSGVAATGSN